MGQSTCVLQSLIESYNVLYIGQRRTLGHIGLTEYIDDTDDLLQIIVFNLILQDRQST
jgi:hypothetical protein